MTLVKRLEEIRRMQGLPDMPDPGVIQGGPPNALPLPDGFGEPTVSEQSSWEEEEPGFVPSPPESPLVAAAKPASQPGPIPSPDFAIIESVAAYKGHAVTLSDQELAGCKRIVLGALQRVVKEQLRTLAGLAPKRVRRARTVAPAAVTEPPRKRGRPRKVQP